MKNYLFIHKNIDIKSNQQQTPLFERIEALVFDIIISIGFIIALSLMAMNIESLS